MSKGPGHHLILCSNSARVVSKIVSNMIKALMILGFAAFANAQVYQQQQPFNSRTNIAAVRQVAILRQTNENNGDGTFGFSYESEDGQTAEARGQVQPEGAEGSQATQGSYGFTAPDGQRYTVSYTAGPGGFQAQGAHLPVAPAIPEAIAKALADNAADEARGIYDDGSYREANPAQRSSVSVTQTNQATYQQGGYQQVQQGGYQQQRSYQILAAPGQHRN